MTSQFTKLNGCKRKHSEICIENAIGIKLIKIHHLRVIIVLISVHFSYKGLIFTMATFFSMPIDWMIHECAIPTFFQGLYITYPILLSSLVIRLCVLWLPFRQHVLDIITILFGVWSLWWYYETSIVYFVTIISLIYVLLVWLPVGRRGPFVSGACMTFIIICELIIVSAVEWHKVRGTFLIVSMKLVSLAYDLDSSLPPSEKKPPSATPPLPNVLSFISYCIIPSTTIFGPYVTYNEHVKYTRRIPLSINWLSCVLRSLLFSLLCLCLSACLFPFLFDEINWNKWLTAYSTASSYRFSHYFVSLMSECSTIMVGLGYNVGSAGTTNWDQFRVAYPLHVEWPRSLGSLVTYWNVPMHHFLKNYVFKPTLIHLNYAGAFFFTFLTSAMLHGLNFQLAAVLLSIALYAYIENKFRYKLSQRLNACVKDRPCSIGCSHKYKSSVLWVKIINVCFTLVVVFHLAYLGVMFGSTNDEDEVSSDQGYSMAHTLRNWYNLDFLSHLVALVMWIISLII